MGCTASKLDNEETVRRCKERCRLMRGAVYARLHLAAAHSDYCRSLRLTGSALCNFAAGESLTVSDNSPAVFLNTATNNNRRPSPPPPPPITRAAVKTSKLPNVLPSSATGTRRRKPPPKLPHILSESSLCSSPRSQFSNSYFPTAHQAHSTTASETSSVWNWENLNPPPSPPGSDYFRQRSQPPETLNSDSESESAYNLFHSKPHLENRKFENTNGDSRQQQQHLDPEGFRSERSESDFFREREPVRSETEREEVQCSDWGDCYSSTSSSEREEGIAGLGSPAREESVAGGDIPAGKEEKDGEETVKMKVVMRHKDLKEIAEAVRVNFEKAAVAGDQLSEMLEISRAQLDRSFSQLRSKLF